MAKKASARRGNRGATVASPVADLLAKLTSETKRKLDGLKGQFSAYADAWSAMLKRRADLADPLMKLYGQCLSELGSLTFVKFLQLIDPTIPNNRDDEVKDGVTTLGYRSHAAYQAGEYLRRLATQSGRQAGPRVRGMNATERLARILATMLPLVADQDAFWGAIKAELQLDDNGTARLKKATLGTQPLIRLPNIRQRFPVRVIHMERPIEAVETPAAPARGRRGTLAA